jgi:Flp pilus assembly protein TadG
MIRRRTKPVPRNSERGITMILVALALLSMLAIVALAIDVITLYSARSETQRAADSAALAAAKMLVDSGVTGDPANGALQTAAQTIATKAAKDVAMQSSIAGRPVQSADVTVTFPNTGAPSFGINPMVSVSVLNSNLPTFFSRIWSRATLTVRASATAEGFNPSNSSSISGGPGVPVVARCVKPFLLPNCDPGHAVPAGPGCGGTVATFFDPTTGAITHPGQAPAGIIGEELDLSSNCGLVSPCTLGPPQAAPPSALLYYPAALPATTNACPSSCGGGTNFEENIECCNPSPISCGTTATAPVVHQVAVDATVFPEGGGGPAQTGVECLIHQRPGNGQDILNDNTFPGLSYPLKIEVGNNHPLAGSSTVAANDLVTSSDSLVTVPVYDGVGGVPAGNLNVIGFLQLFIIKAFPGGGGKKAGEFHAVIVNVSGCGSSATGSPVAGNAVPVRLVHQ